MNKNKLILLSALSVPVAVTGGMVAMDFINSNAVNEQNLSTKATISINNYRVENVTDEGFDFIVKFNSDDELIGANLPFWKDGNYNAMTNKNNEVQKVGNNEFKLHIKMSEIGSGTEYVHIGIHPKASNGVTYYVRDVSIKLDTIAPELNLSSSNTNWTNKNISVKSISKDNQNIIEKIYFGKAGANKTTYNMYSNPKMLIIKGYDSSVVVDKYKDNPNVTVINGSTITSANQLKGYDVVIYDGRYWGINDNVAEAINQAFEEGVSIITNLNDTPGKLSIVTGSVGQHSGEYTFRDYSNNRSEANYNRGRFNRFAYIINNATESDSGYHTTNLGDGAFMISDRVHSDGSYASVGIAMKTHANGNKWIHSQSSDRFTWSGAMDRAIDEIMHGTMKTRQRYEKSFEISENGTYEVEVEDFSGNKTKKSITVSNIDKVAPTMTITGNPTSWVNQATLKVTGSDNLSGIKQIVLPNGNVVNGNTANYTVSANGNYTFKVIDNAGNEYSQTINITKIDNTINNIVGLDETMTMVNSNNSTRRMNFTFKGVVDSQSGVKGYSYVIDKSPTTNPDNTVDTTSTKITKDITDNSVYYLHIKAIDNAGNISDVIHHKVDVPTLTAKANSSKDLIRLDWTMNDKDNKTFKVYQKKPGSSEFQSISTTNFDSNKQVRVLNIYPPTWKDTNIELEPTYTTWDGEVISGLPKSASLKKWMEEPNSEHPKGYGQGIIEVTPVNINEFNLNPDKYLKNADGTWKYDVLMFGTYDSNGYIDISPAVVNSSKEFLDSGRGVLFGHDTIQQTTFRQLRSYVNIQIPGDSLIPASYHTNEHIVSSDEVLKNKTGLLTNTPWSINEDRLYIPYAHTGHQYFFGDVWFKFDNTRPPVYDKYGNKEVNVNGATNNAYLSTYNNGAMIQTGHSNGQATSDEQKILANTLFYLNQLSTDNFLEDNSGQDISAPTKPILNEFVVNNNNQVIFDLNTATDNGSTYEYYVESQTKDKDSLTLSNVVKETITSGLKGYSFVVDTNATTIPDNVVDTTQSEITTNILGKTMYLHVRSVDNEGNASETTHVKISDTTAPTMTITGNPTSWTNKDVTLNINASDVGTGVKHIVLPNGSIVTGSTASYTVSANGNYTFKVVDKMGNETTQTVVVNKIDKSINNISNVFSNMEMIDVKTSKRKMIFTFNPVSESGQSGLKGYSYVIDKNPTTIPDNNIETTSTRIEKEITDTGVYYLHIKAIDNAGNVTGVVHHKVDIPNLTATVMSKENQIKLNWTLNDYNNKTYKVFQKKEGSDSFQTIGATNFDTSKQVKVLNVYPAGVGDTLAPITPITFTTWDGETVTTDLSGSLKKWMEEPNAEHPKGYGQGIIEVTPVTFAEFNANPSKYLSKDSNGKWNYDVVFVGAYDCNGSCPIQGKFNTDTTKYVTTYVDDGYGFLLGHDFNTLKERLRSGESSGVGALASDLIKINKKGIMTSYPWNLGEVGDTLSIPYAHNNGDMVDGDIWFKYTENTNPEHCNKWCNIEVQTERSTNNHYLVTKNNLGMIQTGHSRGQATSDEQKILANTLFYLKQLSTDNFLNDKSGADVKAPNMPKFTNHKFTEDGYIELKFNEVVDNGSEYSYYVESQTRDKDSTTLSNVITDTITSGLKGYSFVIDSNPNTVPDNTIESTKAETIKLKTDNSRELYVHIKAIDNVGNSSETYHYRITDTTAPNISITKNPSSWTNGSVTLTATATDTGSGVKYMILPNGNKVSANRVSYTVDKNGIYFFRAIDYMGNEATVSVVVDNIDKKKPIVDIDNNQNWTNQDVKVTITSEDD